MTTYTPQQPHRQQQQHSATASTRPLPSASSPRDPTIRHAGRAHIRGKIRRVWRPRYLELLSSGLVRYYELPPTADVTLASERDWDHVHMIPKDTLTIIHARIIDVTTLRDLHVGLPRGSFGFLVRGQRQPRRTTSNTSNTTTSNTMETHLHHHHHHHHSLVPIPVCNPLLEPPNPPREYFCAVSTLEEAQTWVIALQWAASMCHTHKRTLSDSMDDDNDTNEEDGLLVPTNTNNGNGNSTTTSNSNSSRKAPQATTASPRDNHTTKKKKKKAGRIVVTKVQGYRIVRQSPNPSNNTSMIPQWQVAYELAVLLIHTHNVGVGHGHSQVEERRLYKTGTELKALLQQLLLQQTSTSSTSTSTSSTTTTNTTTNTTTPTPLQQKLQAAIQTSLPIFANGCTPQDILDSFNTVDQILRMLAMEASIVNSPILKHAFVLGDHYTIMQPPPQWYQPAYANTSKPTLTYRHIRTIPETTTTDDFVKQWLLTKPKPNDNKGFRLLFLFGILQRPYLLVGGAGIVLALLMPVSRLYLRFMGSITMRFDLLVGTWIMAAYLGHRRRGDGSSVGTSSTSLSSTRRSNKQQQQQQRRSNKPPPKRRPPAIQTTTTTTTSQDLPISPSTSSGDDEGASGFDNESAAVEQDGDDYLSSNSEEGYYDDDDDDEDDEDGLLLASTKLSSPLPQYMANNNNHNGEESSSASSCWSVPPDNSIFRVRGSTYLDDRIKIPSGPSPFQCRGVDVWMTDNPQRHIARHPNVLGGTLGSRDTFLVNFLLPFGNFVSYFDVPPLDEFACPKLAQVWSKFVQGDQQYRDARLKLLPVVMEGPWIVKAAVGNGTAPALLGKVIPLQYFFKEGNATTNQKGVYEVDVIITASTIAKGILSVVKGHTKLLTIAFAFIIEAAEHHELPETVLCAFQVHALHLEDCPRLPDCNLDAIIPT